MKAPRYLEVVAEHEKKPSKLSAYQQFCQIKRLEGMSLAEAARMWKEEM